MATMETMTPQQRRQHQQYVIAMSKKNKEEAQLEFEKKCKTQEYKKVFEELRKANAKRGIIIPGE